MNQHLSITLDDAAVLRKAQLDRCNKLKESFPRIYGCDRPDDYLSPDTFLQEAVRQENEHRRKFNEWDKAMNAALWRLKEIEEYIAALKQQETPQP